MIAADDYQPLGANLALWHAFDPKAKAELFSTACLTPHGTLLIDPIALSQPAVEQLLGESRFAGVVVTNANHWRASARFAQTFSLPIMAHPDSGGATDDSFEPLIDGQLIFDGIRVIAIPGGAPGEIALYRSDDNGTLIIGDALIHFDPYGFAFLPARYCANHDEMKQSLRKLVAFPAERMLFAHGTPIMSGASRRLQNLLDHGG
jgi:glyoxylase-like metal-dependent hydrolase (beta-lactamase superfamily II)